MISKISITKPFFLLKNLYKQPLKLNILSPTFTFYSEKPNMTFCSEKPKGQQQPDKQFTDPNQPIDLDEEIKEGEEGEKTTRDSSFGNYVIGISIAAMLITYAMMEVQALRAQRKKELAKPQTKYTGKAQIGGDWQLIDTKGNKFSSKDLEGQYYLIYFGFTNCPDICPNSLSKLGRALAKVKETSELKYYKIKSVFVSVDPDRDTSEKIEKFVGLFDPQMIGVTAQTNNDPNLKECLRKFKIYTTKIEFQDEETVVKGRKAYTIDHTILTYLMSDTNQYLAHIGGNLGEHDIAKTIIQKIQENERKKMNRMKN